MTEDALHKEVQCLVGLPTDELLDELDSAMARLKALLESRPDWSAARQETAPAAGSGAGSRLGIPALRQRAILLESIDLATLLNLEPHIETVYSTAGALGELFEHEDEYPGLRRLAVTLEDEEPCNAEQLYDMTRNGDIGADQPVEVNVADLKQLLNRDAAPPAAADAAPDAATDDDGILAGFRSLASARPKPTPAPAAAATAIPDADADIPFLAGAEIDAAMAAFDAQNPAATTAPPAHIPKSYPVRETTATDEFGHGEIDAAIAEFNRLSRSGGTPGAAFSDPTLPPPAVADPAPANEDAADQAVLSQHELDELLKGIQSGDDDEPPAVNQADRRQDDDSFISLDEIDAAIGAFRGGSAGSQPADRSPAAAGTPRGTLP